MSNGLDAGQALQAPEQPVMTAEQPLQAVSQAAPAAPQEKLDEVEGIDFLLEEIENKIAPLALA
jgi:hypothetical protein